MAAVAEDRLAGNPPPIRYQEFDERHDVADVGELPVHARRLVISDRVRALNRGKKRRIHRSCRDIVDRPAVQPTFSPRPSKPPKDAAILTPHSTFVLPPDPPTRRDSAIDNS